MAKIHFQFKIVKDNESLYDFQHNKNVQMKIIELLLDSFKNLLI
jgi:hypothetical protein